MRILSSMTLVADDERSLLAYCVEKLGVFEMRFFYFATVTFCACGSLSGDLESHCREHLKAENSTASTS